uniref:Immunoglobulin superfamily containing leucine-rich repeat protein 2-like n=1 Tax=Mastacembelus armatus TaxID=205130 RepID=A0A7N9ATF8_9TELE
MAAADFLCFTLWFVTVFTAGLGCPELCTCSHQYGRHFAECSYKNFTQIPDGLPPNVQSVSLSANKIRSIALGTFDNITQVASLWMSHNEIISIEQGTLAPLVHLRNLDISHNKIVNFPWEDLQNLRALQLLKMNHNQMVYLPRDAFSNLKDLRSLQLNNNELTKEDCEVQVLFTTRRRVSNLLIIISVSICLLTVSTVPLLGATCFHLVYKYRSKTYKLILKAKDQYHMERNLTVNFNIHAPHTESQRRINGSEMDEEGEDTESGDGEKEADTEESLVTESFTLSQCRGTLDDCEVRSEYSDRLPLGAEAGNITNNYKYPNQ